MPVGITETLHGKVSAPNAGESDPVQLELRYKMRGTRPAHKSNSDSKHHLNLDIFI